jgi:toxin YhaV
MGSHGWLLLYHECIVGQLRKLDAAAERARQKDPKGFESNANVRLVRAIGHLILDVVPGDPARPEYRQGNTLGAAYRHWRRAKIARRFRVFFRYDSRSRIIVFAWLNDEQTLRSAGSSSDPYAVFRKMLERGDPPDDSSELVAASREEWRVQEAGASP